MARYAITILVSMLATIYVWASTATTWAQKGTQGAPPGSGYRQFDSPGSALRRYEPNGSSTQGSDRRLTESSPNRTTEMRLAFEGFCAVSLRDDKKWIPGESARRVRHDGRMYYFAGDTQKQAFLANPARYVPVLGGDCAVCYTKKRERVPGNIRFGLYRRGRLYFFASEEQKQAFRENPVAYANTDLALAGDCPVCRVDMRKKVSGDPELGVYHDGLRYWFASAEQRDKFLANTTKYAMSSNAPGSTMHRPGLGARSSGSASKSGPREQLAESGSGARGSASRSGSGSRREMIESGSAPLAFDGFCPVCLRDMKKWIPGRAEFHAEYDGRRYYFPNPEQRKTFLADPDKYVAVMNGDCVVCQKNMGERVTGNIRYAMIHLGRLYLFASDAQRKEFAADPEAYADTDLAMDGNCPVCLVEMGQTVPGKPQFNTRYGGMRYLFPSAKQQDMFRQNPENYTNRSARP